MYFWLTFSYLQCFVYTQSFCIFVSSILFVYGFKHDILNLCTSDSSPFLLYQKSLEKENTQISFPHRCIKDINCTSCISVCTEMKSNLQVSDAKKILKAIVVYRCNLRNDTHKINGTQPHLKCILNWCAAFTYFRISECLHDVLTGLCHIQQFELS